VAASRTAANDTILSAAFMANKAEKRHDEKERFALQQHVIVQVKCNIMFTAFEEEGLRPPLD
jgi:hypothetical protein